MTTPPGIDPGLQALIAEATGARSITGSETLQTLWSGYGTLDRYRLDGGEANSVIVKHVRFPDPGGDQRHPRGWNTPVSDQRKRRSYEVETHWYEQLAQRCDASCRVARCLATEHRAGEVWILLEDLAASGFAERHQQLDLHGMRRCLVWLAEFHACFLTPEAPDLDLALALARNTATRGEAYPGLWERGSYWHLATRADEWAAMPESRLKRAATWIDEQLASVPFRTLIHGDAKLANFLFSANRDGAVEAVAAVDFQYVGGGCGMQDVAYFISSCLTEVECQRHEQRLLDAYFSALRVALSRRHPGLDADALEAAWRPAYALAWTDFYRFLVGWSPGHWKIHAYSEKLADKILKGFPDELD